MVEFIYSDGGRGNYFEASRVGDCVCRAICNATGKDYREVYDALNEEASRERKSKRKTHRSSSRNGVYCDTAKRYIEGTLGWVWVPLMGIGTGCKAHVDPSDLPAKGSYILNLSRHFSCWKDGRLYDTYDCSRDGTRCVYGYWRAPTQEEAQAHATEVAQRRELEESKAKRKAMLAKAKEDARKHNEAVRRKYAKRIREAKARLRKLERAMQDEMVPMPTMGDYE